MRNILKSLFIVLSCLITTTSIFAQATHENPATKTYGSKTFFDAGSTPGNAGTNNEEYINYGVIGINSYYSNWHWFSCDNFSKSNNSFSLPQGAVGFCQPGSNSNMEFYGNINFVTSKTNYIDIYVTATTEIGFIYQNNNTSNNRWIDISIKEVSSTGSDGNEVFSAGNNGNSLQYLAATNLDGTKYYHLRLSTSGGSTSKFYSITFKRYTGPAPKSTDATLSDLKVDGTTITGFDPSIISYSYSVAATATTAPVISATKNDSKASDPVITQPAMPTAGNSTTGTVQVTAEDGTTTKTYTVIFTRAELSHDATLSDIKVDGKSISGFTPGTTSYTVSIPYSQTTIPVVTATTNNSGANAVVTAASSVTGTASILVTAEDGSTTKTYTLTFQKDAPSTDATLSSLTYNGQAVSGFNPSTTSYSVALPEGSYVPSVNATTTHPFATFTVQQATSTSGMATITVTAEDGSTTKTYTIQFSETVGPSMPQTNLTLHQPGVYEAKSADGGYGTKMTVYNHEAYEVYYCFKGKVGGSSVAAVATSPGGAYITDNNQKALDGWFDGDPGSMEENGASAMEEFAAGTGNWKMKGESLKLHVKGYNLFKILAEDNDVSNPEKRFKVLLNNEEQTSTFSTSPSTRSYVLSPNKEYLIEVKAGSSTQIKLYGFSLREAQVPKLKYLKGDDSAQVVLQTMPINKVVYTCKYNHIEGAETRLEWDGQDATGISLGNVKQGELVDTLSLVGNANCPVGTYRYAVVTYLHGAETSRLTGQFVVKSDIRAMSSVHEEAYQNEEMDPITFKYYALSESDVRLNWTLKKPQGSVDGQGTQPGVYVIGGTPTEIGTYPFEITVANADTVIKGTLTVKEITYGDNAVLYLYKNDLAYTKDGVYNYLHDGGTYNPISRRAKMDGLRPSNQYANYKWVLISEDVDADNPEILALARGEGNLPVLNMKGFSYTKNRLNWGDPNNGSLTKAEGRYITVLRDDHPIFKALNKKQGDRIQVLDSTGNKGLMPISVNYAGTLCLATARTRDINDYNGDGPEETFLHEVPAEMHRNQKYLCLPIGQSGTNYLHADGKRLIDECIKYILSNDATIQLPDLAITRFQVGSYSVVPDDNEGEILLEVLAKDSDMLKAATPVVTLASPMTHAYPSVTNADGTVDFTNWRFGVQYIVSDYINKRSYDVVVRIKAAQGIDEIEVGEWINIYDIYGRKVATTNEDFRTMDLPRGMYILVTESGKTLKVMR